MNREIGSEFWNVPTYDDRKNDMFPTGTQWFLSGRIALRTIIENLSGIRTIAMPLWCCESMVKPFIDAGKEVKFYPVYMNRYLIQEVDTKCDAVFLMDYFGYTSEITADHSCIIRDVTHSIFSHNYNDADYYFGSLRKWCGIWTGGYAWSNRNDFRVSKLEGNDSYINLRRNAMIHKEKYINVCCNETKQIVMGKSYLDTFNEAEELLNTSGMFGAAQRDIELATMIDDAFIRNRRRKNAKILMDAFPELLMFHEMKDLDCPMFVPILVPNGKRDALRWYLIAHEIYCPIHWPFSRYHHLSDKTNMIYQNELSLVCDQRYTEVDMFRLIDTINKFWKGE